MGISILTSSGIPEPEPDEWPISVCSKLLLPDI